MINGSGSDSGGSLERLREANRLRVVEALRLRGSASRAELVEITGLSRTTITSLLGDLHARGLITADPDRSGAPSAAARAAAGAAAARALRGAALGVAFGHSHVHVAISDLSSTVLAERRRELDVDASAVRGTRRRGGAGRRASWRRRIGREQVIAAGHGRPGADRAAVGPRRIVLDPAGLGGTGPRRAFAERLGDVHVEALNDANLGALAEASLGAGKGVSDVVYVKISTGIGAGLVLGGRLHCGISGNAGEIGHVQIRDDGFACRCGNRGCLETVAAVPAVLGGAPAGARRAVGPQGAARAGRAWRLRDAPGDQGRGPRRRPRARRRVQRRQPRRRSSWAATSARPASRCSTASATPSTVTRSPRPRGGEVPRGRPRRARRGARRADAGDRGYAAPDVRRSRGDRPEAIAALSAGRVGMTRREIGKTPNANARSGR